MKSSAKIVLRQPARRDGTCLLRLQVILNRKLVPVGLNVGWWPELFDETTGRCVASLPARRRPANYGQLIEQAEACAGAAGLAKRAADYNLIIGKALGKANEVLIHFRLSGQPFSAESFLLEYNSDLSKNDFLNFYEAKMHERYRRDEITKTTFMAHRNTLNTLRRFRTSVPFYTLSPAFADNFHAFLKKHLKSPNSWWGRHKNVKTYLNQARRERIKFEDPYLYFKNKSVPGQWRPLAPGEFELLDKYYRTQEPCSTARRVLQRFLFSCCSSLRLGDLKLIDKATFNGSEMTFKIQKTYSKKMRDMMLPLTRRAMQYLQEAQTENDTAGFYNNCDQYSNRTLQRIAAQLELKTHLHHHVGRETFATKFIEVGGSVAVLQKLMDHEKITTTMKYVHVSDDMKRAAIADYEAADLRCSETLV